MGFSGDATASADVQKDVSDAATLQISVTPTFVAKSAKDKLDRVCIVGAQSFAAFQSAIEGLLKAPAPSVAQPCGRCRTKRQRKPTKGSATLLSLTEHDVRPMK